MTGGVMDLGIVLEVEVEGGGMDMGCVCFFCVCSLGRKEVLDLLIG
jgi:hypothetical protein